MKSSTLASGMLAAALLGACTKASYVNPALRPTGDIEKTGHFFLFGLLGHEVIPAYQLCSGGVAAVESRFTFVDLLLSFVTIDIYTPRTYKITCGG